MQAWSSSLTGQAGYPAINRRKSSLFFAILGSIGITIMFSPNGSKSVLSSHVVGEQTLYCSQLPNPTGRWRSDVASFLSATNCDWWLDDSSLENLDVWIIEMGTSLTTKDSRSSPTVVFSSLTLGRSAVENSAGSPWSISAGWMCIHSHRHHCHHGGTWARTECSFMADHRVAKANCGTHLGDVSIDLASVPPPSCAA